MTKVIAECGVNHMGDAEVAREMADIALAAGADYVKFQLFDPAMLSLWRKNPALAKVKVLEKRGLEYAFANVPQENSMVSVFSLPDAIRAYRAGVPNMKLSHIEGRRHDLIRAVRLCAPFVWLSIPAAPYNSLVSDLDLIPGRVWYECIPLERIMACVPQYPATNKQCMRLAEDCRVLGIGYSDHSAPNDLDPVNHAIDEGCPVVEVHVKLDDQRNTVDEAVSKTMTQLKGICERAHE